MGIKEMLLVNFYSHWYSLVTLVHKMLKRDSKSGLSTLCVGCGQCVSVIVKQ